MILDRLSLRLQMTLVGSLLIHIAILSGLGALRSAEKHSTLRLTEVEYQEEDRAQPSELEKLMYQMAKPAAPPRAARAEALRAESIAALEKESFSQAVGLTPRKPDDEISESDLTRLAALPKFAAPPLASPPTSPVPQSKLALVRQANPIKELTTKVIPLDTELPPVDFGPSGISQKGFQQPELVIKQVKAERRQQSSLGTQKTLSLDRGAAISGEVKNRQILHQENPIAPRWLEEKGIEAEVAISFVVNPDGDVGDKVFVEKTSGYAELDQLAIAALREFIFAPLLLTAKRVEQKGTIVFRFHFSGEQRR